MCIDGVCIEFRPGPGLPREFLTDVNYRGADRRGRERCQSVLVVPGADRADPHLIIKLLYITRNRPAQMLRICGFDDVADAMTTAGLNTALAEVPPASVAVLLIGLARSIKHLGSPPPPPARAALVAALAARFAALMGDLEGVDDFTRRVLGRARPEEWREGVIGALLGDWVDGLGDCRSDPELVALLDRCAKEERKRWLPLWNRGTRNGPTRLTSVTIGAGVTLEDALTDHRSAEDVVLRHEFDDERIGAVLRGLTADEAAVAVRLARDGGSWLQAAVEAGLPPSYGDRVRRKLRRRGALHAERTAASARTAR